MAILQSYGLLLVLITLASLAVAWYGGFRGLKIIWCLFGACVTMVAVICLVDMHWADMVTATLMYGIVVIYAPLMWMIIRNYEGRDLNHHG